MPIRVRGATPDDERALAQLNAAGWPPDVEVTPARPAEHPFFDAAHAPADVLVAEPHDGRRILGYARLGRHLPVATNDHVLHLHALVVAPDARSHGVGAALVEAAVAAARGRGAAKIGLRTLSNNTGALRLYERHGFVEEGRLRAELRRPDGSYADDVWMALWLRPLNQS